MGQQRLDSLSLLCVEADMLRSVFFEDVIKDFAFAKSRKRTFWIVYCIAIANVCNGDVNETLACESVNIQNDVRAILQWSKKLCILTCKRDPMARDRDETETFDFPPETRSRPRPSHVSTRPRRDRDLWKLRLETVSRPRRRDRDYIPGWWCAC